MRQMTRVGATEELASFTAGLGFGDLPSGVMERLKELFLDWVSSSLAGKGQRPVEAVESFARAMGPADGPSEVLVSRRRTSPLFAALVNGAASHMVEQDDVHNGSVFHPATVVFPAALAAAQEKRVSGEEFLVAAAAGYEVGIRVGEFLGRSHYEVFHTTGTAGTLAAAAATAKALNLDENATLDALGSAGTQAAGLWQFLGDGADSKQLHAAKAASDGLLSAYLAREGFTGAREILEGPRGLAAGTSTDSDPEKLTDRLGERWAVLETSFKYHASCRHTHPAADALLQIVEEHDLSPRDISRVAAKVHRGALNVLGPVVDPKTVHQAKFSMGFVLALIASRRRAAIGDFDDDSLGDVELRDFMRKVEMVFDAEVDAAYPGCWIGLVEVLTADGRTLTARVEEPKGDPGNTLDRAELEDKAHRLAAYSGAASVEEIEGIIVRCRDLDAEPEIRGFLS